MINDTKRDTKPFQRYGNSGLIFDMKAQEVAILDRSGRAIWKQCRGEMVTAIRWNGSDLNGQIVQTGDYVCKIVYADKKIAYLPFVFMKA